MQDLARSARQQIAAGAQASMRIKSIEAPDQANPRLLDQVTKFFWTALLLATGRAVGQPKVLERLLIAPCNAGWQGATRFLPEVTLRNQGISATDPTVQRSALNRSALWCRNSALSCRIMGATVLD